MMKFFLFFLFLNNLYAQVIVCLGDSLTEGYGIEPEEAYPQLLENYLVKNGMKEAKVINAGISGSTSSSGLDRLKWTLKANPTHLLLALGANDGLRGIKVEETFKNLDQIVRLAIENKIKVLVLGMELPLNYGEQYRKDFRNIYTKLATKHQLPKPPFLLEGVATKKELNLADGIHPNVKGHQVMGESVFLFLKKYL